MKNIINSVIYIKEELSYVVYDKYVNKITMPHHIYDNVQVVKVYGNDCISFLQGQLTNDLNKLSTEDPIQINSLCNVKGRIVALFFTYLWNKDELLIALPKTITEKTVTRLEKYAIFSKVSFKISAGEYKLVYSEGSTSKYFRNHTIMNRKEIKENMITSTLPKSKVEIENIYQRLPFIDITNSEKFLPSEMNIDQLNAISYQKGCFVGQEIIARMKYIGASKKILLSIKTKPRIDMKEKLKDARKKTIAYVVNQVNTKENSYVLAVFNESVKTDCILLLENNTKGLVINS